MTEQCIICLEEGANLVNKKEHYGCNCNIYYHSKCWKEYDNRSNWCPVCKSLRTQIAGTIYALLTMFMCCSFCIFIGLIEKEYTSNSSNLLMICTLGSCTLTYNKLYNDPQMIKITILMIYSLMTFLIVYTIENFTLLQFILISSFFIFSWSLYL